MTGPVTAKALHLRRDSSTGIEALRARFGGHAYDIHSHDDEWLVGVTHQGVQDFYCRGHRRQSIPGRIILIEPTERHDGRAGQAEGFSYSMLYLPNPLIKAEFGGDATLGFRENLADDQVLARAVASTCRSILHQDSTLIIEAGRDVVLERLRLHLGAPKLREENADCGLAERAMEYLQAQYQNDPSSADLQRATGAVSRYQLIRAFRARFDTTPHACLVEIRLARARALLRKMTPPAEVAALCGFADQSHMTRWFRRAYGLTPGAWAQGRTNVQDRA